MNTIYHIAILEGYLAQHPELPLNVQAAIAYLKKEAAPEVGVAAKPKKKRKISFEQIQKMREGAARARAARLENGVVVWTKENLDRLREMKAAGLTYGEIANKLGAAFTAKSVANAAYKNGI